jgi:hypothetical protein
LVTFAQDTKVHIAIVLVAVDLILGICAAVVNKNQHFNLAYVGDLLKNDILGKLVPYFALYVLALVQGHEEILPGIDFGVIAGVAYGLLVLAMAGSILKSLRDLGLAKYIPQQLAGPEKSTTA